MLTWAQTLELERDETAKTKAKEKRERAARLKKLFSKDYSDSDEDLDYILDLHAAQTSIKKLTDKIDVHLQVEKNLLEAWKESD